MEIFLDYRFCHFKNFLYICINMKTNKIIIAIAGDKGSGKDTIATMIEYIMSVGTAKANFREWYSRYTISDDLNNNVIHFADRLKEICSQITNLPIHYFNNSAYKDGWWWIYGTDTFIGDEEIEKHNTDVSNKPYVKITSCTLLSIKEHLDNIRKTGGIPVIKLRTILQFVGTEMFRNLYDEKYWINNTIKRAREIVNKKDFCIIADLRFKDELYSLRRACNNSNYDCVILSIGETEEFEKRTSERGLHESDKQLKEFDYYIQNEKKSYFPLYNKVLQFCQIKIFQ